MKTMLEYQKMILEKVSFDKNIFKKELKKSIKWLQGEELKKLIHWVWNKFGLTHADAINSTVPIALPPAQNNLPLGK